MSCYKCGLQFSKLFRKEYGCAKCGFAFCGRCCSQKVVLPSLDPEKKQLVCDKCYEEIIEGKGQSSAKYSPPAALQRRMEALSVRRTSLKEKATGSEKDEIIAHRLKKLKDEGAVPQQQELEVRLAKLKGLDPEHFTAPPIMVYRPPDTRTAIQKADSLIEQVTSEVTMESRLPKPDEEIAARLAKLRGEEVKPQESVEAEIKPTYAHTVASSAVPSEKESDIDEVYNYLMQESEKADKEATKSAEELASDKLLQEELAKIQKEQKARPAKAEKSVDKAENENEEDEAEANAIVEKILAETSLPDAPDSPPENGPALSLTEEESDELPWCVICTEDAKLRCIDCDQDLYCLRCFRECHDALELREHRTVVYKPKA